MRLSLISVLILEALPAISFPTNTAGNSVLPRHETVAVVNLKVPRAKKASKAGNAAAATNQTALASGQVLTVAEEFKEGVVRTVGVFGSANPVQGGNLFTKMKLPANVSLSLHLRLRKTEIWEG